MTSLNYRGISYQASSFETVETNQQTTFRGRRANVISPVKSPSTLPADIQFFGRHPMPATRERIIILDSNGWATA